MPLWVPSAYRHGYADLTTAPPRLATGGVTITASATPHAKGAWASLFDNFSFDVFGIVLSFTNVAAGATDTSYLLDIGIGPSGGGSEQVIIPDLDVGQASTSIWGKTYFFPIYVPAGKRISARGQAVVASDTVVVRGSLNTIQLYPYIATAWTAFGVVSASSRGTSVPSGNAAFGAWTQIGGSTDKPYTLWHAGFDLLSDTTTSQGVHRINIGFGPNSSSVTQIGAFDFEIRSANEDIVGPLENNPIWCPVPSGTNLFARINGNSTENRGVIIYAA